MGIDAPTSPDAETFRYWAFISYSHTNERVSQQLHRTLESFRLPKRLVGRETPAGTVPARMRPVFRDREEFPSSSDVGEAIRRSFVNQNLYRKYF